LDTERIKQLIAQREAIDTELVAIVTGGTKTKERKPASCSKCGNEGHTARNCPQTAE
jgi:hypothetical protein